MAPQEPFDDGGVGETVAAGKVGEGRGLEGEVGRGPGRSAEPAVLIEFSDCVVAERGQLVEERASGDLAGDHHGAADAQLLEGAGDGFGEFGSGDTEELGGGAGRVQEGAEEVEQGALSAFGAEPAGGTDVPEGRVEPRGEEEGEAVVAKAAGSVFRGKLDGDAEGLQDVGGTGLGRDGAVAVLRDGDAGGGADEGDGGGDVEGIELVAARAADVEDLRGGRGLKGKRDRSAAEFEGKTCDLGRGFALVGEGGEEVSLLPDGDGFASEGVDDPGDLAVGEVLSVGQ